MGELTDFDPDAPITNGRLFGMPQSRADSNVVVIPVPFDATASYGTGSAQAPTAIRDASAQLDLYDMRFGEIWRCGIFMEEEPEDIAALSSRTRDLAAPIIEAGGPSKKDADAIRQIDEAGERVRSHVRSRVAAVLTEDRFPILLGGEHSVSLGAIEAAAAAGPLGILQVDAHADLREAYEGFRYSHASVMHNAVTLFPDVISLSAIGLRDISRSEYDFLATHQDVCAFQADHTIGSGLAEGANISDIMREAIQRLPDRVYLTVDIDGLDSSLCPSTGTPVPGGLTWREFDHLIWMLSASGKAVVGADLVEVVPGPTEWDANVGARVLYKLCALAKG
ncbi:MAG: agmatinase family protein [Planctomycetota bacterium]